MASTICGLSDTRSYVILGAHMFCFSNTAGTTVSPPFHYKHLLIRQLAESLVFVMSSVALACRQAGLREGG